MTISDPGQQLQMGDCSFIVTGQKKILLFMPCPFFILIVPKVPCKTCSVWFSVSELLLLFEHKFIICPTEKGTTYLNDEFFV